MTQLSPICFATPNGKFMNFLGNGAQYAIPNGGFVSEQLILYHLYLGTSAMYSWWVQRVNPA